MKSARRRSREYALQGLYAWLLSGDPADKIRNQLAEDKGFGSADLVYFSRLLDGTIGAAGTLSAAIAPALDRKIEELSPVERAILLLGAFELKECADVPYRVVINEAVELAKRFGGTDGHKYVNGVLDKLARSLRSEEKTSRA
ncbi:MAG: transcription antitermination factor NusB [Betaproteobacteria bacterium]|nr:transcription antitermination factor NusB [Betaproteobacteria bacterium]